MSSPRLPGIGRTFSSEPKPCTSELDGTFPHHVGRLRTPKHEERNSDRPAQADDRSVPGHWEGDLVIGRGGKTAVVTLVERRSRMFFCRRLTGDRSSLMVIDMLKSVLLEINQMQASGVGRIDTLTWDQGTEMARVAELESEIDGLNVYFCDSHSPWQRPSNENINAELRRFHPKKTDFDDVTDADLHRVQELINDTPRVALRDGNKETCAAAEKSAAS
ncbi:IS30 family transposase [Corynebacterium falsenii]|uniref:IS30 family transposase n=1 Tax=Corynebacterium falsenii TaxID=108486 RepID=UPI0009E03994|nr:IS30 family transposase [Corynebacterium falsenii]UBI03757.1 IS30 family transposase [Corynebacterium falsenii]